MVFTLTVPFTFLVLIFKLEYTCCPIEIIIYRIPGTLSPFSAILYILPSLNQDLHIPLPQDQSDFLKLHKRNSGL